jgi:uncharacterized repeat protein (TIGR03803 family)
MRSSIICFVRSIVIVCAALATLCGLSRPVQAAAFSTIYTFNSYCDGFSPRGLLYATDGNYYGVTSSGGTNGYGTVYRMSPDGAVTTLHSFTDATATPGDGASPNPYLLEDANGIIYGTTYTGGINSGGTIFSVNPTTGAYAVVFSFTQTTNSPYYPSNGLVEDSTGNLYGTVSVGCANGSGGIYKISTAGTGLTTLHSFATSDTDGGPSAVPLVVDGTTIYGLGDYNSGVLYSVTTSGPPFKSIYSYGSSSTTGYNPSGLMLGADGKLYITVQTAGPSGYGAIESITTTATTPSIVYSFTNTSDGYDPIGSLIQDAGGVLYGVSANGGVDSNGANGDGVIFSLHTDGTHFTALSTLLGTGADGDNPNSGATFGPNGALVATCTDGPNSDSYGEAVATTTSGSNPVVLHDFYYGGTFTGENPFYGGLAYAGGNYYGTTSGSSPENNGAIFEMTPAGAVSYVYFFAAYPNVDGGTPYTSPAVGFDGDLIGATYSGGVYDGGAVYDFDQTSLSQDDLFDISGSGGAQPESNVLLGSDGNYYLTTTTGGKYNKGAILSVDPSGAEETVVYSFQGPTDGANPYLGIAETPGGTIYGTCSAGGVNGDGTLWSWSAASGFALLHPFNNAIDGASPNGVIIGQDGKLYGTLNGGGADSYGAVYSISKTGTGIDILHSFNNSSDGGAPQNTPTQGSTSLIYGTCYEGGTNGYGTVWQVATTGGASFAVLGTFLNDNVTTGAYPEGLVTEGQDGNLYGTTEYGGIVPYVGTSVQGTIYKVAAALPLINSIVDSVTNGPSGLGGDSVTIYGANLSKATAVKFNGVAATSFTIVNAGEITTTAPDTATTGPLTIPTTGLGTAVSAGNFTILPPTLTSLSEYSGLVGDIITVTGTNFVNVLGVNIGGSAATYTVVSPTEITATVPSTGKTGIVKVTTEGGSAVSKTFTYKAPAVTSFKPASGPVGSQTTITGANFADVTQVAFNGTSATYTVNSTTSITATVPTGATTGSISVTTPGGTKISTAKFTVTPPTITSLSEISGLAGDSVTITGTNFVLVTGVTFGGVSATYTVNSATSIVATVPSNGVSGSVRVTTGGGTATSPKAFVYEEPTITGFTPPSGPVTTSVSITGTGFAGVSAVSFNGTAASQFTVNSPTSITATVPTGATTGAISVTTPGGTAQSATSFTVN